MTASKLMAARLTTVMAIAACCASCTRPIDGSPARDASAPLSTASTAVRASVGPVGRLLLTPAEFPHDYPATVLDPLSVGEALRDIAGVPSGSTVQPTACAPVPVPAAPQDAAAAVGANDTDSSTITVAVTRVRQPLADYTAQLERCAAFQVTDANRLISSVSAQQAVAPPINADDSVAVNQTVSSGTTGAAPSAGVQTTLSLVAQIADIRILATYMTFQGNEPDAVLLDQVFTAAVLKVHNSLR